MIADGKTIYACSTLAIEAQGKKIRTVESFTQGTVLHPVQQAFCDKDGLMCGFCTPGFVTCRGRAARKDTEPDRRAGQAARSTATSAAAAPTKVCSKRVERGGGDVGKRPATTASDRLPRKPRPDRRVAGPRVADRILLGKSIKRLDGPDKAAGRAKYTYDIIRPGMLYGEILGSPHPRARVRSIDLSAAESLPGVKARSRSRIRRTPPGPTSTIRAKKSPPSPRRPKRSPAMRSA